MLKNLIKKTKFWTNALERIFGGDNKIVEEKCAFDEWKERQEKLPEWRRSKFVHLSCRCKKCQIVC